MGPAGTNKRIGMEDGTRGRPPGRPAGTKKRKRKNFHKTPGTTANGPRRQRNVSAESKRVRSLQKEAALAQMGSSSVYDHSGCTAHRDRRYTQNPNLQNLDSVTTVLFQAVDAVEEAVEEAVEPESGSSATAAVPDVTDENICDIRRHLGLPPTTHKKRIKMVMEQIGNIYSQLDPLPPFSDAPDIRLQYGIRQYEIDIATAEYKNCDLCNRYIYTKGAIHASSLGGKRKAVYLNNDTRHVESKFRRQRNANDTEITACTACTIAIAKHRRGVNGVKLPYYDGYMGNAYHFHGIKRPPELMGLTMAEKAVIARIQVINVTKVLKYGALSFSGHTMFVSRAAETLTLHNCLPLLPSELAIVIIKRRGKQTRWHSLRCRRRKVQDALRWLVENSPAYANITIEQSRLDQLPEDGEIQVQVIEETENAENVEQQKPNLGPAPLQVPIVDETESGLSYATSAQDATVTHDAGLDNLAAAAARLSKGIFEQDFAPATDLNPSNALCFVRRSRDFLQKV